MSRTEREYQQSIKHRIQITVPIKFIFETDQGEDYNLAKADVFRALAYKLAPEKVAHRWGGANIDEVHMGDPTFKMLDLKDVPPEEAESAE